MSKPARAAEQPPAERCARCGHLKSEHGKTGRRPCLAMTGDLLHREFCTCDDYRAARLPKAA